MHAASEIAYRGAEDVLRDALGAGDSPAMRVAEDFFGLSDLVRTDARLRRALTDPSRSAQDKSALMLNVHGDNLAAVEEILPSLKSPTISQLQTPGWYAVNTIVDSHLVRDLIPRLKAAGAEDLVELALAKVVE